MRFALVSLITLVAAVVVISSIVVVSAFSGSPATALFGFGAVPGAASGAPVSPVVTPAAPTSAVPASAAPVSASPPASTPPAFDKTAHSLDDPDSIWVVVNKHRQIADAANFVPDDLVDLPSDMPNPNHHHLRQVTEAALEQMFTAAKAEIGTQLVAQSGYRSYSAQQYAYNYYVGEDGVAGADKTSARPGFSEHQTGLAIDILDKTSGCSVDGPCFGSSPSGQWLAANAWRFGFLLRYPADKTAVTGYEYEPWHFRYIGVDLSTEMHNTGVTTLEEFFGLPAAPDYVG